MISKPLVGGRPVSVTLKLNPQRFPSVSGKNPCTSPGPVVGMGGVELPLVDSWPPPPQAPRSAIASSARPSADLVAPVTETTTLRLRSWLALFLAASADDTGTFRRAASRLRD